MCGRFNVIDDPFLRELMSDLGIDIVPATLVNIAPTESIPIVVQGPEQRELRTMRWWLTPSWSEGPSTRYSMFNAKSETIASSRAFRQPFRRRRGIVPVSSFIEWHTTRDGKQPWLIRPRAGAFAFAAIWDHWEKDGVVLESCALITREAVPGFEAIHHRMPVMLGLENYSSWLDPDTEITNPVHFFSRSLPMAVTAAPLDRAVNNARNKDPALLLPVGEETVIEG